MLAAAGLLAVLLEKGTSQAEVSFRINDFRKGHISPVTAGHAVKHAGTVAGHIYPGGHTGRIPAVEPILIAQHVGGESVGRRGQRSGVGIVIVDARSVEASGKVIGGVNHKAEGHPLEPRPAAGVHINDEPYIGQLGGTEEGVPLVGHIRHAVCGTYLGQGEGNAGRNLKLGIRGYRRTGRVEGQGTGVSADGGKGIAHTHTTGRSRIVVLRKQQGILPGLGPGSHGQRGAQDKTYDFFHNCLD